MNRISKRLYLVGFALLSLALLALTLLTYGTARLVSIGREDTYDALLAYLGYPVIFFVFTFPFALGSSLILLAVLGNSLRPKTR